MPVIDDVAARLEEGGYRLTGPRRAVLEQVAAAAVPFTAEGLCEALPGVGRATVFRTVKLLQEYGLICRVPLEDGSVRYQVSGGDHHHHLVCSECGAVTEFGAGELDRLILEHARRHGFLLDGHSLELYGRCRHCREAAAAPQRRSVAVRRA